MANESLSRHSEAMDSPNDTSMVTSGLPLPGGRSNYELMAREMDANLAQMDIETFRTMDINHFLSDLNQKFTNSSTDLEQSNSALNCSVTDSFLCEIEMHTDKLISYINESSEKSAASTTLIESKTSTTNPVGISMDSLDLSNLEPRCADVISRCRSQDKHRYRIAFEKSWHEAMNASNLNEFSPSVCSTLGPMPNASLTSREHPLCRSYQVTAPIASLSRLACLMNRSAHSDLTFQSHHPANDMSNTITAHESAAHGAAFLPLYNLAASATTISSSGNDSTSAPTSLIKMFIQNRMSPSSSGGLLSSYDDSPLDSSLGNGNLTHPPSADDDGLMSEERRCAALELAKARQMQSSPITEEEDEDRSDFTHVQRKHRTPSNRHPLQSNLVDESRPERQKRNIDINLQQQISRTGSACRRSMSMEEFGNRSNVLLSGKPFPGKLQIGNQTISGLSSLANATCKGNVNSQASSGRRMHSRECSVSSGYLSGGGGGNANGALTLCDWSRKAQMTRTQTGFVSLKTPEFTREAAVQTPPQRHDKQVQTSMETNSFASQPPTPHETRNGDKGSPIYVYYPNYSLPDLQFVQKLAPMSLEMFPDLRLSPTRLYRAVQNNSNESSNDPSQTRPQVDRRPKSCGEFEQLNKDQFKHIQDWESLTTLLPKELQILVKNLKLDTSDDVSDSNSKGAMSGTTTSQPNYRINAASVLQTVSRLQQVRKVNSLDSNLGSTSHFNLVKNAHAQTRFCCPVNCAQPTNCCATTSSNLNRFSSCIRDSQCTLRQSTTTNRVCGHSTCDDLTRCPDRYCGSHHSVNSCNVRSRSVVKSVTLNNIPVARCSCTSITSANGCACQPLWPSQCCSGHSCHSSHSTHSHATNRPSCSTPATPCGPISETAEELESTDDWLQQPNQMDFDTFLRQLDRPPQQNTTRAGNSSTTTTATKFRSRPTALRPQNSVENKTNKTKVTKVDKQTSPDPVNVTPKANFNAIRNRWESLGKPLPATSARSKGPVQSKIDTGIRGTAKRRTRSKSPPKSNKEVVIVTKKAVSTLKADRLETGLKPPAVVRNASATSSAAKRPNSFHSQFKSLIPIPKNKIKSPTKAK